MRRANALQTLGLGLLIGSLALVGAGCEDDNDEILPPPDLAFIGSATCAQCHQSTYNQFTKSGHPYKLTAVTGNEGPAFPWDSEHLSGGVVADDGPPPATTWNRFSYVIGGFGWKARFVDTTGYIYTGAQVQLNLTNGAWVPYESGIVKPYDYECFKCHTTGADPAGEWRPGVAGTFAFGGIQCEECHGEGSQHAFDPDRFDMTVDRSAEACGECHTRDAQRRIAAKGGFVQHHEQYDELVHSPHENLNCNQCHDPHASVIYDDVAPGEGVLAAAACTSCHQGYDTNLTHMPVSCTACHMAKTGKSALSANAYAGDISSHVFSINPNPVPKDSMFTADGTFVRLDANDQAATTLDFACYGCHRDPNGVGGTGSIKTLTELSAKALTIHGVDKLATR